ncbi:MAG TPA: OmpA family protein [Alphaproteobacteria bacterium]|nr:OmpA family protein [Alphaproteobacteria bacterium]
MKLLKILGVVGALGVLAACTSDLQRIRTTEPSGGTAFTQALTKEYRDLAVFEADEMFDWRDAGYYARRGLAAAGGEVVLPEDPVNRDLPEDSLSEINDVRVRLLAALDGGARDNKPEIAARAQSRFDCWLEQQEENFQEDHISACRDELLAALAEMEQPAAVAPAPAPAVYLVLFDFDKSNINDAAQAVINQVIADFNANKASAISVTGHTDRAGSDAYNEKLSERRADAVREALIAGGIPADAITTAWKGESENAVPTADGVKEQANRRAEIIIQ